MTRWMPWLVTLVIWNAAFDLQVRRAADEATSDHLVRWATGQPAAQLGLTLTPRVRTAAVTSSAVAAVALTVTLVLRRRRTP